jgi:hypothetical protein
VDKPETLGSGLLRCDSLTLEKWFPTVEIRVISKLTLIEMVLWKTYFWKPKLEAKILKNLFIYSKEFSLLYLNERIRDTSEEIPEILQCHVVAFSAFVKLRRATVTFIMSVRPSTCLFLGIEQLGFK